MGGVAGGVAGGSGVLLGGHGWTAEHRAAKLSLALDGDFAAKLHVKLSIYNPKTRYIYNKFASDKQLLSTNPSNVLVVSAKRSSNSCNSRIWFKARLPIVKSSS